MASDSRGLTARGAANLAPRKDHWIWALPKATRPAPHRAPMIAWVVETGMPVLEASMTQPKAPIRTATKNAGGMGVPLANRPVLKPARRPPASQKETTPPIAVVTV